MLPRGWRHSIHRQISPKYAVISLVLLRGNEKYLIEMKKENRPLGRGKSYTRDWSMCGGVLHRDGVDNCIDDLLGGND
jgi:hypothetical protein